MRVLVPRIHVWPPLEHIPMKLIPNRSADSVALPLPALLERGEGGGEGPLSSL
jgi:hypothetical protein